MEGAGADAAIGGVAVSVWVCGAVAYRRQDTRTAGEMVRLFALPRLSACATRGKEEKAVTNCMLRVSAIAIAQLDRCTLITAGGRSDARIPYSHVHVTAGASEPHRRRISVTVLRPVQDIPTLFIRGLFFLINPSNVYA